MKKPFNFWKYLLMLVIPFLTVACISGISILVYSSISNSSEGKPGVIFAVVLITIIMLTFGFSFCDFIRRKISVENPVEEILKATQRIASGDFSVKLISTHSLEKYNSFDVIKDNINVMANELRKSEMVNTDFISNVSHEIKTPLAIIQNYIFLLQDDLDNDTKKKYINTVMDATKRLSALVTNMLKLNKLENQQLNLEIDNVSLHDMLAEAVINFEELIESKNISVNCELDEVNIKSSHSYLEIVWNNLLSNAIKFTGIGGEIKVSLCKSGDLAIVKIKDNGVGISPETGKHIFEKFYQGDTSHSAEGNGLGLPLVKKVIDLLGGEISVKSELGKGSEFQITLKEN
ncbi:MAG: HAMP domain-containing histidine kinase [Clostridia bacterium]|nr:HAMP domain-containing histidine kinase [Clostridia bacterium]